MASSPFSVGQNPFLVSDAKAVEEGSEHAVAYAMVASGPAVDAAEVESASLAVEVVVRWDDSILHIGHLTPARAFAVGEQGADVLVPADKLGMPRAQLVTVENGEAFTNLLPGAKSYISASGRTLSLEQATQEGLVQGDRVRLAQNTRVKLEIAGFSFEMAGVMAGKKVAGKGATDKRAFMGQAVSFGVHGAIAAALFAFMPALSSTEDADMTNDQRYALQALLTDAEQQREQAEQEQEKSNETAGSSAGSGAPSPGERGAMGSETAKKLNGAYAVKGQAKERTLNKAEAMQDAQTFGMIELLGNTPGMVAANGPTSPWGSVADGPDAVAADGKMWGDELADAYGTNGLDLSGVGEGAGGKWNGIGMGGIDTVGHGSGTCVDANCQGFGNNGGHLNRGHTAGTPKIRMAPPSVSGRIPPEVIQRVVRQNFGRFRACYEPALRSNPNLQGRVAVAFTIGRDGAVGSAQNGGSDLPDSAVTTCIVKSFYGLSFPAPEAGIVTVTYPIMLAPQ